MVGLITYIALAIGLLVLTARRPAAALAGVLSMYGLEQWGQSSIEFLVHYGAFTNFFVGTLVLLALTWKIVRREPTLRRYPLVGWLSLFLFGLALASILWAPREDLSAEQIRISFPYVVTIIVLTPLLLYEAKDFKDGLVSFLLIGAALSIMLLLFTKWELRSVVLGGKYHGNPLAIAQMAGNVMLAAMLLQFRRGESLWIGLKWILTAICVLLMVKTSSRGQLLAGLISLAVFWPLSQRSVNVSKLISWVVITIALGVLVEWALQGLLGQDKRWTGGRAYSDVTDRLSLAMTLLEHWWQGGAFTLLFGLGNSASFDPRILGFYSHVMPLEVLAEEGIVGFFVLILILVSTIRDITATYKLTRNDLDQRGILATLGAMFAMALLLSFKQGNLLGSVDLFLFAILIARLKKQALESPMITEYDPTGEIHSGHHYIPSAIKFP